MTDAKKVEEGQDIQILQFKQEKEIIDYIIQ